MPRAWMLAVVAFELAAAGIYAGADRDHSRFVVPNVPDLTIKTRETTDLPQSTVQIKTLYFKGAWQRRDLYLRFPSALPAQRTMRHTTITRCDERRTLELSHEARLYAWGLRLAAVVLAVVLGAELWGEATLAEFKPSEHIAGVSMRLKPGAIRELHWHAIAAEWAYVIDGKVMGTVISPNGESSTDRCGSVSTFFTRR